MTYNDSCMSFLDTARAIELPVTSVIVVATRIHELSPFGVKLPHTGPPER